MFPWLWIWAPQLHFPWSGSVEQRIAPNTNWFFDAIPPNAGDGAIEKKAFDVASYGRQLGLITEVLIAQAEKNRPASGAAAKALERLKTIRAEIEAVKTQEFRKKADSIAEQSERLRKHSPAEFKRVVRRLQVAVDD